MSIGGNNLVQTNGAGGIQVNGSSSLFISGGQAPDGTPLFTTLEGHGTLGINVVQGSSATIAGAHRIHNNGFDSAQQPEFAGGIRVGSSSLHVRGPVEVINNNGPGIAADLNGTISTSTSGPPPRITGNAAEGMRMTRLSAAAFALPPVISGNGDLAISCDRSSWLFGDTSGINNVKCSNTDKGK